MKAPGFHGVQKIQLGELRGSREPGLQPRGLWTYLEASSPTLEPFSFIRLTADKADWDGRHQARGGRRWVLAAKEGQGDSQASLPLWKPEID